MRPNYRLYNPLEDVVRVLDSARIVCFSNPEAGGAALFVKPKLFSWVLDPDAFNNLHTSLQVHFPCNYLPNGWFRCEVAHSERFAEQLIVDVLFSCIRFNHFHRAHRDCLRFPLFSRFSSVYIMEQCISDAFTIDDRHLPLLADAAFGPESLRDAKERALQQRLSPIYKQILPVCLNEARRARATAENMLHPRRPKSRL